MAQDKEVQLNFKYGDGTTDTATFLVPAGNDGAKGDTGNSAYQDAVASGSFVGTLEQWLESLKVKGDKGDTGPKGDKGDTGPKGEDGPKGADGDPASICDGFSTLPKADEFGEDPLIIVQSQGVCRVVKVPSKGIFTDIRSQAAWSGIALVNGTNTFVASARNVSVTNAGKVRVDIVLPTLPDNGIEYGTTTVSAPNGIVVIPIITTGANRSYYVENLNSGVNVNFNIPVTWRVKGTYQASMTVNAVDPNTVDYSSSDDYSVASYTVAPNSEGEATIDCPLITGKISGVYLAIGSTTDPTAVTAPQFISKCLGVVLDQDKSFIVEFDRAVSIYPMGLGALYGMYDVQQNSNGYGAVNFTVNTSSNDIVTIAATDATNTKFKITFVGGGNNSWGLPTQTTMCFGIKAGANCRTQFFGVSVDGGYRIGQTATVTNNGANVPTFGKTDKFSWSSPNSYDIRHVDGSTHQLLTGTSYQPFYKVEGVDFTLKEATAYDITVAANLTPSTLTKTMLVNQTTTGAVTITYPSPPLNTIRLVASTNTSDHDSTTNGLIKYTFVQ